MLDTIFPKYFNITCKSAILLLIAVLELLLYGCYPSTNSNIRYIEQQGYRHASMGFLCSDQPDSLAKACEEEFSSFVLQHKADTDPDVFNCRRGSYFDGNTFILGTGKKDWGNNDEARKGLISALAQEDLDVFFERYVNAGMCYFNKSDFASAKHYVDNFSTLVKSMPLFDENVNGLMFASFRLLPASPQAKYWHAVHEGIQFYENTLRTKHRFLCGENDEKCLNSAWELTNLALDWKLREEIIKNTLNNSEQPIQAQNIWNRIQHLYAKEAIVKLIAQENLLQIAAALDNQLNLAIKNSEHNLNKIDKQFINTQKYLNSSFKDIQSSLSKDDIMLIYVRTMEIRRAAIWQISHERAKLTSTKGNKEIGSVQNFSHICSGQVV